jgi:7,8-dihydropterin-6-yl-methyl-4-(beta-D-ribofuranosyl)aminobenzene 5'-phosphate synthase
MKGIEWLLAAVVILIILSLLICFAGQIKENEEIRMEMKKTNATLITVYDNYESNPELKTGWGFSCLVKTSSKGILFDTGADSPTLLQNMEKLGIDPKDIDIIVLSHIHGDHVGGLTGILEKSPNVAVYLPKSFPEDFKNNVKSYGSEIFEVHDPAEITEGVYTTGELGTWTIEQSLIVNTEKGLVVITGCAHPGIVKILEKTKKLSNRSIYLVIGGFHLSGASDSTLKDIISSFRKLGVEKVAPCHCSGEGTRQLFKDEYVNDYISNGVGEVIEIG